MDCIKDRIGFIENKGDFNYTSKHKEDNNMRTYSLKTLKANR